MIELHVTQKAASDIKELWRYIAADSIEAADRVISVIQSSFDKLAEHPNIGHRRDELDPVYRVWRVYSYLIVYRQKSESIQIVRVVSGYRDLRRLRF